MRAVIPAKRTIAMSDPPGMSSLMLDGQSTDGRTNQARNENRPSHGEQQLSAVGGVSASSKAVSQMTPTMR